jgi:hypothetical protein
MLDRTCEVVVEVALVLTEELSGADPSSNRKLRAQTKSLAKSANPQSNAAAKDLYAPFLFAADAPIDGIFDPNTTSA